MKFNHPSFIAIISALFNYSLVHADEEKNKTFSERQWEELVIIGSYQPKPAREIGSAVTVLTSEDIDQQKTLVASDLLREIPGLAVSRTGPVGALTQVRIRGAEGNHTQVFIDGIDANNPFGNEFNFANMMSFDIGHIEVLRGPQSALYGSDSIGGVINISTPEAITEGIVARAEAMGGSMKTSQTGVSLTGKNNVVSGHVSASRYMTDGISTSAKAGNNEKDGYDNTALHGKLIIDVASNIDVKLVARHVSSVINTDGFDYASGLTVDADSAIESAQFYGLAEINMSLFDDSLLQKLSYNLTNTSSDSSKDGVVDIGNRGERQQTAYHATGVVETGSVDHSITGGIQYEKLNFRGISKTYAPANQKQTDKQTSFIGEYAMNISDVASLSGSVRRDFNDMFNDATTYRATVSYLFTDISRFHASYGKGISNPGFYELFGYNPDTFVGNPNLKPEHSKSYDTGIELALFSGAVLTDITYFNAALTHEIQTLYGQVTTPTNKEGKSYRQGVELTVRAEIIPSWTVFGAYTYLHAKEPDGRSEVRRPIHTASLTNNIKFMDDRINLNIGAIYNGSQQDNEFAPNTPTDRANLDEYTLLNTAVAFEVNDNLELFVRGENLLNEKYTEVYAYRTTGPAGYMGIRLEI